MSESKEGGGFSGAVLGALVGTIVGVGVGLLVAPERGDEFRRRVAFNLDQLANHMADLGARMSGMHGSSEASRSASELVEGAQRQADQIMRDANDLISEIKRVQKTAS
jgi:gas vesicle protein